MPTTKIVTIKPNGWGNYASLSAALTGEARDLTLADEICRIEYYGALDDLHGSTITIPAGFVTSATQYIEIVAPQAEQHEGVWSTSHPILSSTAADVLSTRPNIHLKLVGLQIDHRSAAATQDFSYNAIQLAATTGPIHLTLERCIIRYSGTSAATTGPRALFLNNLPAGSTINIVNCVFYGWPGSIIIQIGNAGTGGTVNLYNNTVHGGSGTAYYFAPADSTTGTLNLKNNVSQGQPAGSQYSITATGWTATYDKNLSGDATAPLDTVGGGNLRSRTVTFEASASGDFRLAAGDTGAADVGTDLSADAAYPVTLDFRGATRSGTWDVGAHERGATVAARPGTSSTLTYDVTPAATSSIGDWAQWEVTDATFLSRIQAEGDLVVTDSTGQVLPVYVIARRTSASMRVSVAIDSPTSTATAKRLTLTATDGGTAWVNPTDWSASYAVPSSVGPSIAIDDGNGNVYNTGTPMDEWVHPNVMRVDNLTGNAKWLTYKDAAEATATVGTITHIRIDTPFPGGNDDWENPYLLYSTDNGLTWAEFSAALNPVEPWPGGTGFNSDPCFAITSTGALRVFVRQTTDGVSQTLYYRDVTGTHVGDATASARTAATGTTGWTAPSIVKSGSTWYLFYRSAGPVRRMSSTDEGATWSGDQEVLKANATADGLEYDFKYWHGSVVGPIGGYYYATYSENNSGAATDGNTRFRLWRSASVDGPWEAAHPELVRFGTGIAATTVYQGCLFEKTDGTLGFIMSGQNTGVYKVGVVSSVSLASGQAIDATDAFRFGESQFFTSNYATSANRGTAVAYVAALVGGRRRTAQRLAARGLLKLR